MLYVEIQIFYSLRGLILRCTCGYSSIIVFDILRITNLKNNYLEIVYFEIENYEISTIHLFLIQIVTI